MPPALHTSHPTLSVQGGLPLEGTAVVSGAKNAALPIMAASLLAEGPVLLAGVPVVRDVQTLAAVLRHLGIRTETLPEGLRLQTVSSRPRRAPASLVRRMRASFCVLGPLLARRRSAAVALPGGCRLGHRPVDLHLRGLTALGADIQMRRGYVLARARRLRGAQIEMTGPRGPSVTGTANVMSAAVLARGTTVLCGAAREPEVVDLGGFLNALGARIAGLGTPTITICGVAALGGGQHRVIPDRIEAATLLLAGVVTQGCVQLRGADADHLAAVLQALERLGAELDVASDGEIRLAMPRRPRAIDVLAAPYPGLPSDVQAPLTAALTLARGNSRIGDAVFPERFSHVGELARLGADVDRDGSAALVRGVRRLQGAAVAAADLRAAAALVLAGLAAEGTTTVRGLAHLERGYEGLDVKLAALGGRLWRSAPDVRRTWKPGPRLRRVETDLEVRRT